MSKSRETAARAAERFFEWVDIVGPNRMQIELAQQRLALPPRLTQLSFARFLYPTVVSVPPAWFFSTLFTAPSVREVFKPHPLQLWFAPSAIVTISLKPSFGSVIAEQQRTVATQGDFVGRVLTAAVASHEDVLQGLNEVFFGSTVAMNPRAWHRKELRLAFFVRLLERQLAVVRTVERKIAPVGVHDQLRGLREIARHAHDKVRQLRTCRLCSRAPRARH